MTNTIKIIMVTLILTFGAISTFAGAGHSDNASEAKIERSAKSELNKLVATNKIAKSWQDAKLLKMKKQSGLYGKEWLVSFKNSKIEEKTKQVLYIYLTTFPKVKGSNYTGN